MARPSSGSVVPSRFRGALLFRSGLARVATPTDPCRARGHLRSIGSQVEGLAQAGWVSGTGALAVRTDIDFITIHLAPADPCLPTTPI